MATDSDKKPKNKKETKSKSAKGTKAKTAKATKAKDTKESKSKTAKATKGKDTKATKTKTAKVTKSKDKKETKSKTAKATKGKDTKESKVKGAAGLPPKDEDENVDVVLTEEERDNRKRRLLLLVLLLLLLLCSCGMFFQYWRTRKPIPELVLPNTGINYEPHYLFSFYGMDQPVGITISPDGNVIYVSESRGERYVRMFDREGEPLGEFYPPESTPATRSHVYMDVDQEGNVYATDSLNNAIFMYDAEGNYLETILGPELTLSEYISKHLDGFDPDAYYYYNTFLEGVQYIDPDGVETNLPAPDLPDWSPLGINVISPLELIVTDLFTGNHNFSIIEIPRQWEAGMGDEYEPEITQVGTSGSDSGELLFPNQVVIDSRGNYYVSDGNNGRISVWDEDGEPLYIFGRGTGLGALSLPRGIAIDQYDRLYVVDSVSHNVKVYDVSGEEPEFLFAFGEFGDEEGRFNFPNDIVLDSTGRLYIVDRENNRIQVWSY